MNGTFYFLIKPKAERYNNTKKIGDKELILNSGKPSNIVEKILEGKMKKFYSEITFFNQNFILDPDKTVRQFYK